MELQSQVRGLPLLRALSFSFNLTSIRSTAQLLLNRCRVPTQVMVDNMPALTMKIDPS